MMIQIYLSCPHFFIVSPFFFADRRRYKKPVSEGWFCHVSFYAYVKQKSFSTNCHSYRGHSKCQKGKEKRLSWKFYDFGKIFILIWVLSVALWAPDKFLFIFHSDKLAYRFTFRKWSNWKKFPTSPVWSRASISNSWPILSYPFGHHIRARCGCGWQTHPPRPQYPAKDQHLPITIWDQPGLENSS